MACRVRLRALLVPVLMLVALATSEQVRLRPEVVPAHGSRVEPATAAPFGRIRRQHIQNAATAGLAAPSATAQARSRAGGNERCHRAILRHPQNCPYIRKHCAGYGDGIFSYVELYYCAYAAWHGTVLLLMTAWLALLFVWLGVSASEYFSPNIGTLARLLRLPESLAGVTLLALGNGAPDLFSTFSAVRAGSGALALGQLIGSASFIISVVVGATTLVAPVYKVSQLSYLRELCFFVATIGMVAVIVLSERLSRGLAICMVGLYIAYVVTVMVTTYYEEQRSTIELPVDCASSLLTGQNERLAEHMIPEPSPLDMRQASESHRAAVQLQLSSIDEEVGLRVPDRPHSNAMSVRVLGDFLQHHPKSLLAAAECSDIINEMRTQQSHHGVQTWPTGTAGCCVSDAGPSNSTSCFTASSTNGQSGAESARADEPDLEMSTEDLRHCADNSNNTSYFYLPLPLNSSERPRTKGDIAAKSPFSLGRCENMMPSPLEIVAAAATHRSTEGHALRGDASPLFIESTQQYQQGHWQTHGAVSLPAIELNSTPLFPLPTALASTSRVNMLACSSQQPSSLSVSNWNLEPVPADYYLLPSASLLLPNSRAKLSAVVHLCIPTLRHWRPDASAYLKLFIATSAVPVLLLSLTVPVVAHLPKPAEEEAAIQRQSGTSSHEESAADHHRTAQPSSEATSLRPFASESEEAMRGRPDAEVCSLERQQGLAISALPLPTVALSRPSSSRRLHSSVADLAPSHYMQSLNAAAFAWAEEVVSYLRAAVSMGFLYSTLNISDHFALAPDRVARFWLGLALVAASLLGNYMHRQTQKQHYWLQVAPCFVGFASGLAWVYLIAAEIVSITQALGLMLGLSEEILGLTVVGFGNSLGDLVTNLTLTRMGYPMMAISACFGGPMLCLLIGVGVAAYGLLAGSGPNNDAYRMPITSPTVLVSTACLLLNSLIFLVAIPWQNYHMTRAVGLSVMAVYFTGLAVNIYLEW